MRSRKRFGAEAAEHHTVRRADAVAGVHGDDQLRHHAHIKADAVAFFDAEFFEHVGELVDLAPHVAIGQHALVARLAFPDDRRFVFAPAIDVAIEAIVGRVELAADEPLCPRRVPLQNFFPRLEPMQLFGGFGPEGLRIFARGVEHAALLMLADFLNSLGGGKFLFSSNKTSIALSAMVQPPSKKFAADQENVSDSIEASSAWQEAKARRSLVSSP